MKITFEGHSCFTITGAKGSVALIDPFISDNPQCKKEAADFHPDLLLVTHGHSDHLGDALAIARQADSVLAGPVDLLDNLTLGKISSIGFNIGGVIRFLEFTVIMTQAIHGSRLPDGKYAGLACGYIISDGQTTVYHAGDTALFGDMQTVISRYPLDFALLPIGGYYTMGPEDAVTAVHWLQPKTVIPMHYNTFPAISQDPELFKGAVEDRTEARCLILAPGESVERTVNP
ncbi:MAG: metal-dependent hydrolase [Firmicutes bacterium]|nr:metal-dependent hydrolase [Bacillota bacterium]